MKKSLLYFEIIFAFVLGAILGNVVLGILHEMALMVCAGILGIAFIMMFIDKNQERKV